MIYAFCLFCTFMMTFLKAKAIKKELTLTEKVVISAALAVVISIILSFLAKKSIVEHLPSEQGTSDIYLRGAEKARREYNRTYNPETEMTTRGEAKPPSESSDADTTSCGVAGAQTKTGAQTRGSRVDTAEVIVMSTADRNKEIEAGKSFEKEEDHNPMNALAGPEVMSADLEKASDDEELAMGRNLLDAQNAEQLDAIFVFRFILVLNACLESFAHGSNDTANATGPFSAIYQFYSSGRTNCNSDEGSVWILSVAGIFVAIGVVTFGRKVIKTIGSDLTVIDYHKGFWIEFASTMATMTATVLEFPVSTTHCQVGAVVGVGLVTSCQGVGRVSWSLFGKIFATWVLTLPLS